LKTRRFVLQSLGAAAAVGGGGEVAAQSQQTGWKHRFWEVPGKDVEGYIKAARLAILPLGAVEYHGPSGPTYTDCYLSTGIADLLGPKLKAAVFPVVSYTHCPAHTVRFPGTISIRPEVITMYLADVLRGMAGMGFTKVFVLNGHSGNTGPAQAAISQVTGEVKALQVLSANWWETLTFDLLDKMKIFTSGNGGRGHGGPLELSSASVFAPDGSVVPGAGPDLPALERMADFPHYLEKYEGRNWPGYSGKQSEISREAGSKLIAIASDRLNLLVEAWLKDPARPGSW
jgi:creatinine amidohydrolase